MSTETWPHLTASNGPTMSQVIVANPSYRELEELADLLAVGESPTLLLSLMLLFTYNNSVFCELNIQETFVSSKNAFDKQTFYVKG